MSHILQEHRLRRPVTKGLETVKDNHICSLSFCLKGSCPHSIITVHPFSVKHFTFVVYLINIYRALTTYQTHSILIHSFNIDELSAYSIIHTSVLFQILTTTELPTAYSHSGEHFYIDHSPILSFVELFLLSTNYIAGADLGTKNHSD